MRFTIGDVLAAAERLARGAKRNTDLADAQRQAMHEDSIPNLVRDMVTETLASAVAWLRRRSR